MKAMAEIYFLGTGGWIATPERDNTSFLLSAGGELVLIDCPGSVVAKLRRLGFDPGLVSTVLLTHTHPDHVYGLPSLLHSLMLTEGEVTLLGSAETVAFARRLLDLFELRAKRMKTRVRFRALRPGPVCRLNEAVSISGLRVPHHSSSLAYHVFLDREGKEIVLSGDTPIFEPLFAEARGVDCLIHEASGPAGYFRRFPRLYDIHTTALDLGRWAEASGVRCLVPCHFLADVWSPPGRIRAEIRRRYRGRLVIPRDLQRLKV
jgi:ribonuclease Z